MRHAAPVAAFRTSHFGGLFMDKLGLGRKMEQAVMRHFIDVMGYIDAWQPPRAHYSSQDIFGWVISSQSSRFML